MSEHDDESMHLAEGELQEWELEESRATESADDAGSAEEQEDHPLFGGAVHHTPPGGRRAARSERRRGRSSLGCLFVLLVVAAVVVAGVFGVSKGLDAIKAHLPSDNDYAGDGTGEVLVEVKQGDTATDIGRTLQKAGVVKTVKAFYDAAVSNEKSKTIQVGFYQLRKQMQANRALAVLVDPTNLIKTRVVIPEGYTVRQIVKKIAKDTGWAEADVQAAVDDTPGLALPDYASGKPEGYLFPATYDLKPTDTPATLLAAMVARWREAERSADLEAGATALGYTPAQIMIIASLIQAEGRGDDMPKIARVIYNRLENPTAGTVGFLQIDATINYALGKDKGVALTQSELNVNSPYNTRTHKGLPPGPIDSPGQAAIEAALHPADGPWFYYVTVNLATGETKFATTAQEFQQYKQEYLQYCKTSTAC